MGSKNQSKINTISRYKANWKQSRCKLKKAGANWKKQVQTEKSRCKQAGVSRCKWAQTTRICIVPLKNQTPRLNSSPSPFLQEHKTSCLILEGSNLYAWFLFSSDPIPFQRFHQWQNHFFLLLHLENNFKDMQILKINNICVAQKLEHNYIILP